MAAGRPGARQPPSLAALSWPAWLGPGPARGLPEWPARRRNWTQLRLDGEVALGRALAGLGGGSRTSQRGAERAWAARPAPAGQARRERPQGASLRCLPRRGRRPCGLARLPPPGRDPRPSSREAAPRVARPAGALRARSASHPPRSARSGASSARSPARLGLHQSPPEGASGPALASDSARLPPLPARRGASHPLVLGSGPAAGSLPGLRPRSSASPARPPARPSPFPFPLRPPPPRLLSLQRAPPAAGPAHSGSRPAPPSSGSLRPRPRLGLRPALHRPRPRLRASRPRSLRVPPPSTSGADRWAPPSSARLHRASRLLASVRPLSLSPASPPPPPVSSASSPPAAGPAPAGPAHLGLRQSAPETSRLPPLPAPTGPTPHPRLASTSHPGPSPASVPAAPPRPAVVSGPAPLARGDPERLRGAGAGRRARHPRASGRK